MMTAMMMMMMMMMIMTNLVYVYCRHGRDNKLIVWRLGADDESSLSTVVPLEPESPRRPQPWMLYLLDVNAMNFCSFAWCPVPPGIDGDVASEILVAVPNSLASDDVGFFLPWSLFYVFFF